MSSAADSSAASGDVLVRRENGILIVTINRPDQRNAVNGGVSSGIAGALDLLDGSSDLRVGVLHGNGSAFCAGMDLKAFAAGEQVRDPSRGFGGIVERPPAKPLIAAVEGWALGGGFEIVLACDMVTAGKGARFGLPEVRRGLAARGGGVFRLPRRLPHALAMELIVTGAPLDAARAEHFGTAVALESADWPLAEGFQRQRAYLEPVFASQDAAEGVAAFRERRDPVWQDR